MPDHDEDLHRLRRRGTLTITTQGDTIEVRFKALGPYGGRGWCTTDTVDLFQHCRLGAKDWHGEGLDLAALLAECEEATRPEQRDVDSLAWAIERRRESRVYGPPLPSWTGSMYGWRPGQERWLRTSSHAHEYLAGYLQAVERERADHERWSRLYPDRYPPRVSQAPLSGRDVQAPR